MKLKYIFQTTLAFGLLFLGVACSTDKDPLDAYSDVTQGVDGKNVVFKNKADVESHMKLLYNQLKDRQEHWYLDLLVVSDIHSDNAYAGTTGAEVVPFENNGIDGTNAIIERDWNRYLEDIGKANKLIINVDSVNDKSFTKAERASYKAQGKIFRAMVFFDMVHLWGSIPVITFVAQDITSENIEEIFPEYFPKQSTELEVYKQIESDLLDAIVSAPDYNSADKTLFTKTVAYTLLAKIYAEKPLRDYAKVIEYADKVTASGPTLVSDFSDLFGMNTENNDLKMRNTSESILEAQFLPGMGNWVSWMLGRDVTNWDYSFTWAKWVTPSRDLIKLYTTEGDNVRFNQSVVYYTTSWSNYYPTDKYPFMYKCRAGVSSFIKYRYADVLLLKAEALIMKDSPDLDGAANIINQVRNRVGLPELTAAAKANKENLLNAYLKERRMELAFEGQRWFDLVRLDKVEEVMNAVYAKDSGRKSLVYKFDENSYRMPIPQASIDINKNLVQNPGY